MAKGKIANMLLDEISKLDMSDAARMQRAKDMGYDIDRTYTHSGGDVQEIKKDGLFDGIFASSGDESMHGFGSKETTLVPLNPIARGGDFDLDYEKAIETIKKEYPSATDEEIDLIYDMSAGDKNVYDFDSNPLERFGYDDLGEASWEGQRLRGRIAVDQGFDAIEMSDEHGVSYLFPAGSKARSIKAAFDPTKKGSPNLMASVAPTAAGIGYSALTPDQAQAAVQESISPANSSTSGLLSQAKKAIDSGVTTSARGPINQPASTAENWASKYNEWRKSLGPVDYILPVGELPEEILRKKAYGERVTMSDRIKATFGLL
jgi:hypothetical protein